MTMIEELSPEEYRQYLAGFAATEERQGLDRSSIKDICVRFATVLPSVYGEELDRKQQWDHIANAIRQACAKTASDDLEHFSQCVLSDLLSSPSAAASNDELASLLAEFEAMDSADREAVLSYFSTRLIPILVHARARRQEMRKAM